MKKIVITGCSDDLINVSGDISEEWSPASKDVEGEGVFLSVSDGTLLRVRYDEDGIWRIARIQAGTAQYEHKSGDVVEDTFDVVTLTGDINWVALSTQWTK